MKNTVAIILALALMLAGTCAFAVPMRYSEGTAELKGVNAEGKAVNLSVQALHLLGVDQDGNYLIYANREFYTVAEADMGPVLALLDDGLVAELRNVDELQTLVRGNRGDAVVALQQTLRTLGYLEGSVDGDFGGATERAVRAFQAKEGLEETGTADGRLQLLALSMTQTQQNVIAVSAEEQFAAIADRVDVDLTPAIEGGLTVEYDDMTGRGFISNGETYRFDMSGEADIDMYQMAVRFGLLVRETEDGVKVEPAVEASCLCVRRPMLSELIVKSGSARGTLPLEDLTASLEGVNSLEKAYAVLPEELVEALANAAEAGELKLRLIGKYNSFNLSIEKSALTSIAKLGEIMGQLR